MSYYKDVIKPTKWFTFKYFVMLSLLLTIALGTKLTLQQIPATHKIITEVAVTALTMYPNDLVIKINNNQWSINKPEPLIIPLPESTTISAPGEPKVPKNAIVLSSNGTIDDLAKYDTWALVNSKNLLLRDSTGFKTYPLENLPNGEIKKQDYSNFIDNMLKFAQNLPYIFAVLIYIGTFLFYLVIQGSNILSGAIFVWLIGKFIALKPSYIAATKVTTHTATLPLTLYTLLKIIGITIPVAFWVTLLNILIATIVIVKLAKPETPAQGQIDAEAATTPPLEKTDEN